MAAYLPLNPLHLSHPLSPMSLPNAQYSPSYQEEAYSSVPQYDGVERDLYSANIFSWPSQPAHTVHTHQPSQHLLSQVHHPPQLSVQTQFTAKHFVHHSTANATASPVSSSPRDMYSPYNTQSLSEDWRPVDNLQYSSGIRSYGTAYHHPQQQPSLAAQVKREIPQYHLPLADHYPQHSYQQRLQSYDQSALQDSHNMYGNISAKGLPPFQSSPPPEPSHVSPTSMNMVCNPQYVAPSQDSVSGITAADHSHSREETPNPSIMEHSVADGFDDDDREAVLCYERASPGRGMTTEYLSSPSTEDDDDADFDPRDPDYVDGPVRRGRSSASSRSGRRYSPYSTSSAQAFRGDMSRRTMSNASESSVTSSSSCIPLTPTSPTASAQALRSKSTSSLPIPIPVPELTKKSRGRRVPTINTLERGKGPATTSSGLDNGEFGSQSNPASALPSAAGITGGRRGAAKGVRMFTCKVPGCDKCFARGEHLKRHVRSIHTYEKPHKCPHPNCDKEFSRHDNLNQHMRVHRRDGPAKSR